MRIAHGSAALFLLLLAFSPAPAAASSIENFRRVGHDLYRGARPDKEGLRYLKSIGVRTILNLEHARDAVRDEMRSAAALGIREISIPMWYLRPRDRKVDQALEIIADPRLRPLYVHCRAGRDRTGLVMAISRVEHEGWRPRDAYQEMLRFGFHRALFWMADYVRDRIGYER